MQVPTALRAQHASFMSALERLPLTAPATAVIHADCGPMNAIRTPLGQTVLVDWDAAGVGPPLIDLGYLLLGCTVGGVAPSVIERRIASVLMGYQEHRGLSAADLDDLTDALRFAPAVAGARRFVAEVTGCGPREAWRGWWSAYDNVPALRARICAVLDRLQSR